MGKIDQDYLSALIARNLADVADSDELKELREWIDSYPGNKAYFDQIKHIWESSEKKPEIEKINTEEALKEVTTRIQKKSVFNKIWLYWRSVAAILILPLAGMLIGNYTGLSDSSNEIVYNEVYAPVGTRSSLRLSDSTMVWLNSGSSLKYPVKFDNKNRVISLKGEAYFEVKRDPDRPFIVQTQTLEVKATGTVFNVQAYDSYEESEITLVSGKVFVKELNSENIHPESELKPNQHLSYNRITKQKGIINEDAYRFTAWKDGKQVFRNEPLDKVLKKLGNMFNVEIETQGKELQDYRYRATFQDESLEEILTLLKLSAPIDFTVEKRTPMPDGSYQRKKVIIFSALH